MLSYTLHYFNHRGRAGICRMLFAAAGIQYTDKRVESAEWDNLRSSYHSKSNIDIARVDFISDCFYGIMDDYMRKYQDKDGRMTSEIYMRFQETCSRILPFMENTLEMYNGGNQFFMGDQMTMADMMCYCALENPMLEESTLLISYPKRMALRERVIGYPKMFPICRNVPRQISKSM